MFTMFSTLQPSLAYYTHRTPTTYTPKWNGFPLLIQIPRHTTPQQLSTWTSAPIIASLFLMNTSLEMSRLALKLDMKGITFKASR